MQKLGTPFPALSEASRSVLVDLLVHGPASRADLARRAGLSPASLTRITRSFVDAGVVSESDTTSPQRTGRPSQPMDVNVDLAHLVGIKLSGGQLNLVTTDLRLVDGANGGSGQVGHLPVTEWGPLCERGHRGCVRSYPSSTATAGQVSAA